VRVDDPHGNSDVVVLENDIGDRIEDVIGDEAGVEGGKSTSAQMSSRRVRGCRNLKSIWESGRR